MRINWLAALLLSLALPAAASAQGNGGHDHAGIAQSAATANAETQQVFERLKALAGSWEGRLQTTPADPAVDNKLAMVNLNVASMGHTLVHDMSIEGRSDHPFTMLVVDGGRLLLTHYCDADNRPRMVGKASPDGRTIEFDFLDISGNLQYGHMHHVVFTVIDADHHTEEWTFMTPGDRPTRAHFDLHRVTGPGRPSAN